MRDNASDKRADEALRAIEREWNAAALRWDPDRLTAIYTDDAVFFGGRPGISLGQTGIRVYFASYVGLLKSTRLELVDQHLRELAPDTFLAQGYGKFQFLLESGKESSTVMRTTLLIVKREGQWRILEHHFSTTPESPPIPQ